MLPIAETIVPIFAVILLGLALRRGGFLPLSLLSPLNRLVYYLAIPAVIFRELSRAPFARLFDPALVTAMCLCVVAALVVSLALAKLLRLSGGIAGTFAQSSFHGNLGYVGLAVAFYFLGNDGLAKASILAAPLMLIQNALAVGCLVLMGRAGGQGRSLFFMAKKVLLHPVIITAVAGVLFSLSGARLPVMADRTIAIIAGMALPLALLVIGASLSFGLMRNYAALSLAAGAVKLLFLPGLAAWAFTRLGIGAGSFLPALILLAAPSATITYVMAREMGGSPDLATAAISINTLLSAASYVLWLSAYAA
ncbi:MAG: AEC family transporter [Thermodesulfobacteriota bacterium]